jgi:hypothetical protein
MNRREFLDARRKLDKTLSGSRLILMSAISSVVLLALYCTPVMKSVERPHWSVIAAELAIVIAGFRYVDRIRRQELRTSHGVQCARCLYDLLDDGGIRTILTCDCPHCGARVFESDQPILTKPILNRTVPTRSQFLLVQADSVWRRNLAVSSGLSYISLGLVLVAFMGVMRFSGSPDAIVWGAILCVISAVFVVFARKMLERRWKPQGDLTLFDCPKCRPGRHLQSRRSLAGPDGRCRKCKTIMFVEDPPDRSIWNDMGVELRTREEMLQAKFAYSQKIGKAHFSKWLWIDMILTLGVSDPVFNITRFISATISSPLLRYWIFEVFFVWVLVIWWIIRAVWFVSVDGEYRTEFGLKCPVCKLKFSLSDFFKKWPWFGELLAWGCCPGCKTPLVSDFEGKRKSVPYEEIAFVEGAPDRLRSVVSTS